jgi:hypothetical protein
MSRTGTVAGLFAHEPEPRLGMHPDDLSALGCDDLELVKVSSRRGGRLRFGRCRSEPSARLVYLPMHWGARFLGGEGRLGVNELTIGALDPSSKQPELKHCAVRVQPAKLPWRLAAFGGADEASTLFEQLTPFMTAVPFAARTLIGRERTGVRLVLAAEGRTSQRVLACIDEAFACAPRRREVRRRGDFAACSTRRGVRPSHADFRRCSLGTLVAGLVAARRTGSRAPASPALAADIPPGAAPRAGARYATAST